jgi:hypothetical protein
MKGQWINPRDRSEHPASLQLRGRTGILRFHDAPDWLKLDVREVTIMSNAVILDCFYRYRDDGEWTQGPISLFNIEPEPEE